MRMMEFLPGVIGNLFKEKPEDSQQITKIVKDMQQPIEEIVNDNFVERPWGSFKVLNANSNYKIKEILINPGHRLSLQMHLHRSEHWIVISGTATVTKGEEVIYLTEGQSVYIPACTKHRVANEGKISLIIVEIQDGSYTGEDDIIRFDDDYNRV